MWKEAVDETGRPFYFNTQTGETKWAEEEKEEKEETKCISLERKYDLEGAEKFKQFKKYWRKTAFKIHPDKCSSKVTAAKLKCKEHPEECEKAAGLERQCNQNEDQFKNLNNDYHFYEQECQD